MRRLVARTPPHFSSSSRITFGGPVEPQKLITLVRGELDWIVMKAVEKDRVRRYETANGFAADIQRYLADEAVAACPPSAAYLTISNALQWRLQYRRAIEKAGPVEGLIRVR